MKKQIVTLTTTISEWNRIRSFVQTHNDKTSTSEAVKASYEDAAENIRALEKALASTLAECTARIGIINNAISSLDDPMEQSVMLSRYLDGMTWDEISMDLSISLRTAHRIHRSALTRIQIPGCTE